MSASNIAGLFFFSEIKDNKDYLESYGSPEKLLPCNLEASADYCVFLLF